MSSTSGEVPADRSVVGSSGGDAAAEVRFLKMITFFSFGYLRTHFSSSACIPFQITHGTARSASAADGANASKTVRHVLKVL